MQASSSLPAITYTSSVLFPSSGGGTTRQKPQAKAAVETTAQPEAWSEVRRAHFPVLPRHR